ncbi:hypothetical protein HDV00_000018 [Rhizophlyctis rosea]|nr:hypothetical protein HDV00_000018 [Rhizophlyctis rosea]
MGNTQSSKKHMGDRLDRAGKTGIVTLTDAKLKEIPEKILAIKTLKNLDLSKNKLTVLPPDLSTFTTIKFLSLSHNTFSNFPPPILSLRTLTTLNLSHNTIKTLPSEITSLTSLKSLLISHNALVTIPQTITHLKALVVLDVSHNGLLSLPEPDTSSSLQSLEELNLEYNHLTVVQPEWAQVLPVVKTIKLAHNNLAGGAAFPASILFLTPVTQIDVQNNTSFGENELSELDGYDAVSLSHAVKLLLSRAFTRIPGKVVY